MIRVVCPGGHFIADVDVTEGGAILPRGQSDPLRHGLSFDYVPNLDITCIRAKCFHRRCTYDGSIDYGVLRDQLAAAVAQGQDKYSMPV